MQCHAIVLETTSTTHVRQQPRYIERLDVLDVEGQINTTPIMQTHSVIILYPVFPMDKQTWSFCCIFCVHDFSGKSVAQHIRFYR